MTNDNPWVAPQVPNKAFVAPQEWEDIFRQYVTAGHAKEVPDAVWDALGDDRADQIMDDIPGLEERQKAYMDTTPWSAKAGKWLSDTPAEMTPQQRYDLGRFNDPRVTGEAKAETEEKTPATGGSRFNGHWIRTPQGLKFVIDHQWQEK